MDERLSPCLGSNKHTVSFSAAWKGSRYAKEACHLEVPVHPVACKLCDIRLMTGLSLLQLMCFKILDGVTYPWESPVSLFVYLSRRVLAKKKMTADATRRNPATEAIAIPTTSGSDTYSSQCSPLYHQFSPTRHLPQRTTGKLHTSKSFS